MPSPANLLERTIARLAAAIEAHTAKLQQIELQQSHALALVAERIDRLISEEKTEAEDVREIRRILTAQHFQGAEQREEIREEIREQGERLQRKVEDLSGPIALVPPEQGEEQRVIGAAATLIRAARKLPNWAHWLAAGGLGGLVRHLWGWLHG